MDRVLPSKIYPGQFRYLTREFLKAITELSFVVILGLFVTFGAENFRKRLVLLTEGIQSLRLDGLLTLIAITHGKLEELITLIQYPEHMTQNVKKF